MHLSEKLGAVSSGGTITSLGCGVLGSKLRVLR